MSPTLVPWFTCSRRSATGVVFGIVAIGCNGQIGPGGGAEVEEPDLMAGRSGADMGGAGGGGGETVVPPPVLSGTIDTTKCTLPEARLWKLTPAQHANTLRALFPRSAGGELVKTLRDSLGGVARPSPEQLQLSVPHVSALFEISKNLAADAPASIQDDGCVTSRLDEACVRRVLTTFGARAFRRPLETEEVDSFTGFWKQQTAKSDATAAFRQMVQALLMSPSFVFRSELGDTGRSGQTPLTPHERAAKLSYLFLDGPPDAELAAAAASGALAMQSEVTAQVKRLLGKRESSVGVLNLMRDLYGYDRVRTVNKNMDIFPDFSAEMAADMAVELDSFIADVLWRGSRTLGELLTSRTGFVNERLALVYGLDGISGDELRRVELPAGRNGLLGHAAVLTWNAVAERTDIVKRGKYIRKTLLCGEIPPPPPTVNAIPPRPEDGRTQREQIAQHSSDPTCAGCHSLMDPLAFPLEVFDAIGRYRTSENGRPIDARGTISGTNATDGPVDGPEELSAKLGASSDVADCFVQSFYTLAQGRAASVASACTLKAVYDRLQATNGDIHAAIEALVAAPEFLAVQR